ncbi:SRPBCC family protein [Actinoplanes sp. NPDC048988]|uniref:SRPBCC family protein n=1 Tax=Actinoplanes sp. NPDC048988 TaxID=3363901 RepID=UPI00371F0A07
MSMVQQAIEVSAPLHTVYEQLAAFENYPRFMSGVREVTTIGGDQTHWIMDVEGKTREFDAQITERRVDERVSWSTMEGPLLAETLTLRPLGETKTQVVAQLEADIAFLMPNDRHGQQSLNRRLKDDLTAFKGMVEGGASTKRLTPSPAAVAARARHRPPHPGAGWGTSAAERSNGSTIDLPHHGGLAANRGTNVDITSAPGIRSASDLDDVLPPGRRITKTGPISGAAGTAPMGGRTPQKDAWGDGMINEEDRGSAQDL